MGKQSKSSAKTAATTANADEKQPKSAAELNLRHILCEVLSRLATNVQFAHARASVETVAGAGGDCVTESGRAIQPGGGKVLGGQGEAGW